MTVAEIAEAGWEAGFFILVGSAGFEPATYRV